MPFGRQGSVAVAGILAQAVNRGASSRTCRANAGGKNYTAWRKLSPFTDCTLASKLLGTFAMCRSFRAPRIILSESEPRLKWPHHLQRLHFATVPVRHLGAAAREPH